MLARRLPRWMVGSGVVVWLGSIGGALGGAEAVWGQEPKPRDPAPTTTASPPAPPRATPEELLARAGQPLRAEDPLAQEIVAAHNKIRSDAKLPPLAFAPGLTQAAQVQAADMAESQVMRHEGSDGSSPAERIKRAGYRGLATGENVAVFYPDVAQVMQGWFESPHHKANILGDFTELGIARVVGKDGKPYWCVDFGKPIPLLREADATADFVRQLNQARAATQHPKLAASPTLSRAAQEQAVALAKVHGKGGTPTAFRGLDTQRYSELAMSTAVGAPTAEAVLTLFLADADAKARLLGPSTEVGIGYSRDSDETPYWCLILAKPRR